ncbi:hypothetical protein ED28_03070 [[Pantoea] beijingensis]|uniref:Uncharacterized protein n=1 Tax=[Pantoea] beijingensis TaxID=1324864 RepID=A0A443IGX5_9GAMM|nr:MULTISPECIES: hypothetical protein [Erwiniaceae]RWR03292.1 hypothetical protein ED28_03070 [[Pantoea] beijingensis]
MKLNKKILAILSLGIAMLTGANSASAIEVYPIIKDVKSDSPRDNFITVRSAYRAKDDVNNQRSETQQYEFVTLEMFEIKNPGENKEIFEKELGKTDPILMFSPTRLVIPYGEERKVRLMPLKNVDKEKVYRLRIRPAYPEQALEKGKVRFAIGYDVLIRYLPAGKHEQGISISCNSKEWTITSTGNVRSEMRNLVIDGRKGAVNFNVYPGTARSLPVSRTLAFEMDNKMYTYDQCKLKE